MSLWADGLFEECDELELLDDYAIYLGSETDTYEITVLKTEGKFVIFLITADNDVALKAIESLKVEG